MKTIAITIAVTLVSLAANAGAQDNNPNSAGYHALHNAQSPNYVGPRNSSGSQGDVASTGQWEKTWGAIATSKSGGALGTAVGLLDRSEAERVALADCQAKGGSGCKVSMAYQNQCAVMVIGKVDLRLHRSSSIERATANAYQECAQEGDECRVYYSACTEPVYRQY